MLELEHLTDAVTMSNSAEIATIIENYLPGHFEIGVFDVNSAK
jgi:hypothetical protein